MIRLIPAREAVVWIGAFVLVSVTIVTMRFESNDPDSALYAGLAGRLAQEPVARWIAPEWWGFWPEAHLTGYFREHPAGLFLISAALTMLGLPAAQGAYVAGVAAGLASLLLMAWLIRACTSREEARAAMVLLQVMPVAFIFRIRANHEYPMLVCLLASVAGLLLIARGRSWAAGALLVAAGLTAGLFIKGVFVAQILLGLVVWTIVNPVGGPGARGRMAAAIAAGTGAMVAGALAYDAAYLAATTEPFWRAYWVRQLGPLEMGTPIDTAMTAFRNLAFYLSRLIWHPAPWSIALLLAAWRTRGRAGAAWRALPDRTRRGALFALIFAGLAVLFLSPVSRFAERYAFAASYAVAGVGVVAACRIWPGLLERLTRWDATLPALPAIVWAAFMLGRLALDRWIG